MATYTGADTRLKSLDQAISYGRQHGQTAREYRTPPETYAVSLQMLLDGWKGSNPEWIKAGEGASRSAYMGE